MRMDFVRHRFALASVVIVFGAGAFALTPIGCSSDDPATPSGTADTGTTGSDAGADTVSVPLSTRAQKGLAISPFAIDTAGMSDAEKESIGLGSYLVNAVGDCNGCHQNPQPMGPPRYLGGGTAFPIDAAGSVVYARNLTKHGTGMFLDEAQFITSMRTGKDFKAGGQLIVMPWANFRWMSTADLKAIYAYLRKAPEVANPVPNDIKGAAAAGMPIPFPTKFSDGTMERDIPAEDASDPLWSKRGLAVQPVADPAASGALAAGDKDLYGRGSYLAMSLAHCVECHTNPPRSFVPDATFLDINTGSYMTGGAVFPVPPGLDAMTKSTRTMSANLLGATHGFDFTEANWKAALVEGKHHTGRPLGFPMPATTTYKNMVDGDLKALFTYFKTQDKISGTADKIIQNPARYCAADADCDMAAAETCNTATKECIGRTCTTAADCGACQTCAATKCAAPGAGSACLFGGL